MDRRTFAKVAAGAVAAAPLAAQQEFVWPASKKMIGIQVGAVSFIDEGVDPVLDNFERLASVTTLFVATFPCGRGIGGRQVPRQPLADHGRPEYGAAFH